MKSSFQEIWENYFKPEVRRAGQLFFAKGAVTTSQPSETEIVAYIKGSSNIKVSLKSPSIQSKLVIADCSCPVAKKGRLCKHIWACLLKTSKDHADFLDGKNEIEKKSSSIENVRASKKTDAQIEIETSFKEKQAQYRKDQYQKQKIKLKEKKNSLKKSKFSSQLSMPADVIDALKYFLDNGFPLADDLRTESVNLAKKKLSRIFHPDVGGNHAEILELNEQSEILLHFIKG